MRWRFLGVLVLLRCGILQAAEVCYPVDITGWTIEQRNHLQASAVALRQDAGESAPVTRTDRTSGLICFENPQIDLTSVLTPAKLLARFAQDQQIAEQVRIAEEQRQQEFSGEITGNDFCTAELSDLTDRINQVRDAVNADIQAASTVPQLKTALTSMNTSYATAFRKVARCVRARAR